MAAIGGDPGQRRDADQLADSRVTLDEPPAAVPVAGAGADPAADPAADPDADAAVADPDSLTAAGSDADSINPPVRDPARFAGPSPPASPGRHRRRCCGPQRHRWELPPRRLPG